MEQRISIKRIIIDLLSINKQLIRLFKDEPKYHTLLNYLIQNERLNDEDCKMPTFKEMEQESGIKIYHIKKQIQEIYDRLFHSENETILEFPEKQIWFSASNGKQHLSFKSNHLNYIPRVGENINLPFAHSKLGTDYFYVTDIMHWFDNLKQIVIIYLRTGLFNSYWHNRLQEAKEKKELPWREFYDLDDYELKKKLL